MINRKIYQIQVQAAHQNNEDKITHSPRVFKQHKSSSRATEVKKAEVQVSQVKLEEKKSKFCICM